MALVLAVANPKGGVGKTTTTVNLAAALAERGSCVLALDLDPQASLTVALGFDPDRVGRTIVDALPPDCKPLASMRQRAAEGFDLVPANRQLNRLVDLPVGVQQRVQSVRLALGPLREDYDYVLMDCPANLGLITGSALVAADAVLIPLAADHLALRSLEWFLSVVKTIRQVANPNLVIAGVVITMFDSGTRHARKILSMSHAQFESSVPFFATIVPQSVVLRDAALAGSSALRYAPHSSSAAAYRGLAREVAEGVHAPPLDELHAQLAKADVARAMNDIPEAYAGYSRATELDAGSVYAWLGRAATAPEWAERIRSSLRAQELGPERRDTQDVLDECVAACIAVAPHVALDDLLAAADVLHASGRDESAARLYRAGTERDWNSKAAWLGLVHTAADRDQMLVACDRVLAINPDNAVALARVHAEALECVAQGAEAVRKGDKARAHLLYGHATELDPSNDDAWVGRARTAGDLQEAFELTRCALLVNPYNVRALELYHCLYVPEPEGRRRWPRVALFCALAILVAMAWLFGMANPLIAHWLTGS